MQFSNSLVIFLSVFGVYFTGYASIYIIYGCKHKVKHASPFWTIVKSDKKPCAKVLEYATYVSSVYASPMLLAGDVASICILLFYKIVSSYQAYNLGGLKIAIMQFA